ncbi:unnamed protein product, partial [marine sediment metagenome]
KEGLKVIRFPFPIKLKPKQRMMPYFYNINLIYYLYFAFWLLYYSLKEKPEIIHLHSRFSLAAAVFAKFVLRIPLVFTLRDVILFCPTGICLHKKEFKKEFSNFSHFWKKCSLQYLEFY